jgi:hypothetical protein
MRGKIPESARRIGGVTTLWRSAGRPNRNARKRNAVAAVMKSGAVGGVWRDQ